MNDNLEKSLANILDKSLELAEKTGQFVIEQGGELLEQFFMWHTATAIFWIGFALILIPFCWNVPKLWSTKEKTYSNDIKFINRYHSSTSGGDIPHGILVIGGIISSIFIFMVNLYKLIYILVAPKLYLIDYFININK